MHMDWGAAAAYGTELVPVPKGLLRQLLEDGICPLHLRLQIARLLKKAVHRESMLVGRGVAEMVAAESLQVREPHDFLQPVEQERSGSSMCCPRPAGPLHLRTGHCVAFIAAGLSLADLLAVRTTGSAGLEWAMLYAGACGDDDAGLGPSAEVCNRIQVRLWLQRIGDMTKDTEDETVFETQTRAFAHDALRRRMEAEMQEAKVDMERQIHRFQAEVDRRMEEQAVRVHAIVEDRVQQQLDVILATEMEKVRVLVDERVQGRIRAVVQKEVQATVCEMQVRLATLAQENGRLRTAFLEHLDHSDLCFRSLLWALNPNATGFFARTLRSVWCCKRRIAQLSAWLLGTPQVSRRERARVRLEELQHLVVPASSSCEKTQQGPAASSLSLPSDDLAATLPAAPARAAAAAVDAAAAAAAAAVQDDEAAPACRACGSSASASEDTAAPCAGLDVETAVHAAALEASLPRLSEPPSPFASGSEEEEEGWNSPPIGSPRCETPC